ncbi:MAG: DUF5710 domain-containing protein [Actinomycetota bacterium]|nr:DUF5710 domain-containing protein [Actinomycetota bacterium]
MSNAAPRVPRSDIETVKHLGARWDATERHWFVPPGRDSTPFAIWLPPKVPDSAPRIPVDVILLPDHCYRCGTSTSPVVGIWFDHDLLDGYDYGMLEEAGGWFLPYDEMSADVVATACPDEVLAAHGAGPLRWRVTRVCPDGYLANTCQHCATVLGNWPLYEALVEYRAEGSDVRDLPHVTSELPEAALQQL